ncbi:hypothetical protein BGZ80_008715, partial [Entomortierella chlamydospora]
AERDCTLGLKLDSKNVKALWRRGIARRSLEKIDEAKNDFESALKIDPANKAVKEELDKLRQRQPEKPKASAPPTATTKQSTVSATEIVQPKELKTPAPSPAKDKAPPQIISSKRVMIKEVENDQDSTLFAPSALKKSAVSVNGNQPTPTAAPLIQTPTSPTPSKNAVSPNTVPPESQSPTATADKPSTSTPPATPTSPSVVSSAG